MKYLRKFHSFLKVKNEMLQSWHSRSLQIFLSVALQNAICWGKHHRSFTILFQPFSDLDEMDYEDEFEHDRSDVDVDVDMDDDFKRRYRLEDVKMLSRYPETKARRHFDDNTLTTMSYSGAQVKHKEIITKLFIRSI
jgi:hypothetical protein